MKLILKRAGSDLRDIVRIEDGCMWPRVREDDRLLALHTEGGDVLPCQLSSVVTSTPGAPLTVTVTFRIDGNKVVLEGDTEQPSFQRERREDTV